MGAAALADPGIRRIGRLMGAAVIGLSATQVNILVNTIFASHEVGANTWLQMAFRLMQLPLGVFGVAIATVAGAGVAQRVAAGDMNGVRDTLGSAMRLVAFLNVPAAVGLIVLAHPINTLVYEHGRFGGADAAATADALVFYAVGLYGYSAVKVFAPAFYALDEARIPVLGSVVGMASNVVLVLALHPVLGFRGIALGTALAATANFGVLAVAWKWRHGGLGEAGIYRQLARTLVAAAAMTAVVLGTRWAVAPLLPPGGMARQAPLALVPIATGAVAYFLAARLLGVKELGEVASALRRRRRGAAVAR
jgi:putative peptidoglycan lipid II flippase